ncbi:MULTISPECIES: succinate dehydrogenase cytochrome b subunit [Halobacteriovorax]|uniref:Succinate dehydrogenase cytochrome b subunit n=1 Tax=Halobacteriovorax vibrionivorans TaxID=2152716 RepID=A0ABY0IH47_9BACT|nr:MULTISPECIES: succinate dehydrogenase cytochrome b subunit [Halobacteriovorax]AYF44776.1 succinate dehydrogenase cytochrome B subunit, b558 family [Halobacteriovorax sp. BALOs_7]RZF20859.1 succinate dehydrogenase cytochrome b subunit [Halobacteriovorax vibrionivorans]TGD48243.1 succinate dehydrogenase cytochrome b subunit [Halobacteriovorax sp. Y22]
MSALRFYLTNSIAKKQVMGVTGLLLCGFLFSHMLGNFLLIAGKDAFNQYAYTLTSNPLIYLAEAVLLVIFLSHIFMALKLTIENKAARPVKYYMKQPTGRGSTFASSTMPYTGMLILFFLVMHLINFKYGDVYMTTLNGMEVRDLYKTVIDYFASPLNVGIYVLFMITIGIHVSHGFWSAFQSIGFNHPKYMPAIQFISKLYAVILTVGYSTIAIWCHVKGGM